MTGCSRQMAGTVVLTVAVLSGACAGEPTEMQRVTSGDLAIVLLSDDGTLNRGKDDFVIEFRRSDGSLVDAGTVTTSAHMSMPGMPMAASVQVERSDVPGRYRAAGEFGIAGTWQMKVDWNGPAGQGSVSFDGAVQ